MQAIPNLVWLRSFEAAARHLSFTAAARELGLTQTALSLHVRSLEQHLGCQLFTRAARNLTLTEVGQTYSYAVKQALGGIATSTASLFGASGSPVLTVRVPISTATLFLAPRLPDFSGRHPGIPLRMVSNIWAESVGRDDVDVEITLGIEAGADRPSRLLSSEKIVPIGRAGGGSDWQDAFADGPRVQILSYEDMWQIYRAAHGAPNDPLPMAYVVDTTVAAIDIVAAGGGVSIVLERFARTAIETGKQIDIIGPAIPFPQSHHLLGPVGANVANPARDLFETWLIEQFS